MKTITLTFITDDVIVSKWINDVIKPSLNSLYLISYNEREPTQKEIKWRREWLKEE